MVLSPVVTKIKLLHVVQSETEADMFTL